jgi:hypothetical protein
MMESNHNVFVLHRVSLYIKERINLMTMLGYRFLSWIINIYPLQEKFYAN